MSERYKVAKENFEGYRSMFVVGIVIIIFSVLYFVICTYSYISGYGFNVSTFDGHVKLMKMYLSDITRSCLLFVIGITVRSIARYGCEEYSHRMKKFRREVNYR